jgi:preprotein translocase subunit YajC
MLASLLILAQQEGAKTATSTQEAPGLLGNPMMLMMLLFAMFYFIVLRPMKRQQREQAEMMNKMEKNDEVILNGGIYGTVVATSETEDKITVKIDDNTRVKVLRAGIMRNLTKEEAIKAAKAAKSAKPAEAPKADASKSEAVKK